MSPAKSNVKGDPFVRFTSSWKKVDENYLWPGKNKVSDIAQYFIATIEILKFRFRELRTVYFCNFLDGFISNSSEASPSAIHFGNEFVGIMNQSW